MTKSSSTQNLICKDFFEHEKENNVIVNLINTHRLQESYDNSETSETPTHKRGPHELDHATKGKDRKI
jgi:hypothetical protein